MNITFEVLDTKTNENVTELHLNIGEYLFNEEWTKGLMPGWIGKTWWELDQYGTLYLVDASGERKEADSDRFKVKISEN